MGKKIKHFIFIVFLILIIFISSLLVVGASYYANMYPDEPFDQIFYYLLNGVEGTSKDVVNDIIKSNIVLLMVVFFLLCCMILYNPKNRLVARFNVRGKNFQKQIFPVRHKLLLCMIVFLLSTSVAVKGFNVDDFVLSSIQETDMYEKYFVLGDSSYIDFPEEKRNLIFISAEAMESSFFSKENGGVMEESIIPELEQLAKEYVSFSNSESLGGAYLAAETHYTAAATVAQTAGIPLKATNLTINSNGWYTGDGEYLKNAYTLGDVLAENGYNLEVMMGSEADFGARGPYFKTNGNYKVFDVNTAIETGKMTEEDRTAWGFDDEDLFEWSKEEILALASEDKPFHYMLQTVDTHFPDGDLSENAELKFPTQYENVYAYSSKCIYEFVQWIMEQDFYENTTIVILGDHLNKQESFYSLYIPDDYDRTIYNVFINAVDVPGAEFNNRTFVSMDFYPTMLASIGVKIKDERLGLGTNLFSGRQTLAEELGLDYINTEAKKKSTFYNLFLLGSDYYNADVRD